jgi:hypothetical protein
VSAARSQSYEADLHRLDVALRELKVKYDQFFAGALDRQPFELRAEIERIIDRIRKQPPQQYAVRFRYNALVSRYNSFSELWGRTLRTMEEGSARKPSAAERLELREHLLARCVVREGQRDQEDLKRLHRRFVAARERRGKAPIPLDKFLHGLDSQTRRLRAKHGCDQIEVRLVESGDEVQIRARPGR